MDEVPDTSGSLHKLLNQLKPGQWAVLPCQPHTEPYFVQYCPKTHNVTFEGVVIPNANREDALEALVNGVDGNFDAQPWDRVSERVLPPRPWDASPYLIYFREWSCCPNERASGLLHPSTFCGAVIFVCN